MEEHPIVRALVGAVVAFAAITAFCASALFPYADAGLLATFGFIMATGAGLTWLDVRMAHGKWWARAYMALLLLGMFGLIAVAVDAIQNFDGNQKRCAQIQHQMLDGKPDATDLPALFSALDCSPRGNELLKLPAEPKKDAR